MGRRFGTVRAIGRVLLLLGMFAGVAHLDGIARTLGVGPSYTFTPRPAAPIVATKTATIAVMDTGAAMSTPRDDPSAAEHRAQYDSDDAKTVVELQQFRRTETAAVQSAGMRVGTATLTNLNPTINVWFLLTLDRGGPNGRVSYHIENPDPGGQQLHLVEGQPEPLVISSGNKVFACDLWSGKPSALERATALALPYAPLCDGDLYLRNRVAGHFTDLEAMTEFLRDNVWNGEAIVGFVRSKVYEDAYRETSEATAASGSEMPDPLTPASLGAAYANAAVVPRDLGIDVAGPPSHQLGLGHWYPARGVDGVYASVMQPQAVGDEVRTRDKGLVNGLDSVEGSALDYFVAFDLSQYDLRFALGTDHPRLSWSPHANAMRNGRPGPDGFETPAPLVTNGIVSPAIVDRVVATFAGGFKREHGAFVYGELSRIHHASHYGFIEQGVVFSKIQPGLATLFVLDDGSVQMKTWTQDDDRLLAHVRFARQNGVPLVESDPHGQPVAGALVSNWGQGNWSGSADAKLRTLRAGACILESGGKQYLVHGYFSTATPSAMALVFHAYGCRYAMLLDMNALEHTYLALYARRGDAVEVEHVVAGMTQVDKTAGGRLAPRFLGFPDNRDFFYLVRRKVSP